jgi:hypothetical protein
MFEFVIELISELLIEISICSIPRMIDKWIKWLCSGGKKPMDQIKKESGNTLLGVFFYSKFKS